MTGGSVLALRRTHLMGRMEPRSLAGKPLAGFRATPSRRNPVLYGMVVYAMSFKNPLLHRQSTLRKRRLGENRVSGQTSRDFPMAAPSPPEAAGGAGPHRAH